MSGVVTVLFTSISLNHFVRPLLTREGKEFSEGTVRVLSSVADTCVFFQVGLDIALTMGSDRGVDTRAEGDMIGWVLLALLASRTLSIFPIAGAINCVRRGRLPWAHVVVLWHSAMRGAGAYAFALVFPGPHKDVLVDLTATVVLISVLFYATSMRWLVTVLGVGGVTEHGAAAHGAGAGAYASIGDGDDGAKAGAGAAGATAADDAPAGRGAHLIVSTEADDSDEEEGVLEKTTRSGAPVGESAAAALDRALAAVGHGAGAARTAPADAGAAQSYRTVIVAGARVYVPTKKASKSSLKRAINSFDTRVRWAVSGIIRER